MEFIKNIIDKNLFKEIEKYNDKWIVRVNAEDIDDNMVSFYECIVDHELSEKELSEVSKIAKEKAMEQFKVSKKINIDFEIRQCKKQLADLDYKTIKYIQNELSEEEWQETCAICNDLRRRINDLEEFRKDF